MVRTLLSLAAAVAILFGSAQAQIANQSALKPPPGARVALIEFADLECPMCGRENPVLKDAVAKYHVPWVRHDFPLQMHRWSKQAAINARWFDTKSQKLGDDYRDAVFANQLSIETPDDLRNFTDKFAKDHGTALPFVIDPQGKFAAAVDADYQLGIRLGVQHTPTAWIVTDKGATEVTDFNKLYTMLDTAIAQTGGNTGSVKQASAKQARK